ncbi:MAG: hypothetical protein V7603_3514 [Micromonosporaceae bacterium]
MDPLTDDPDFAEFLALLSSPEGQTFLRRVDSDREEDLAWLRMLESGEARAVIARNRWQASLYDTVGAIEDVEHIANWILAAGASGIAGQVAYDLIKNTLMTTIGRLRSRRQREPTAREIVEATAILAVLERCRTLDITWLEAHDFSSSTEITRDGCLVELEAESLDYSVRAHVVVPVSDLDRRKLEVRLWIAKRDWP